MVLQLMPFKLSSYALTDIGLVRENNEDVLKEIPELSFYALADGMGGHLAGEVAAEESVQAICKIIKDLDPEKRKMPTEEMADFLYQAIEEVNQYVFQKSRMSQDLYGMGTTLCCLLFHENKVIFGHVGDSRIYRLRHKQLIQLTKDHSLVSELVDLGELTEDQADTYSHKNIVTKAIGTDPYVTPSVDVETVEDEDLYLICSDGLSDLVSNEEIEVILNKELNLDMIAQLLTKTALMKGGTDNISIILVKANLLKIEK